MRIRTPGPSVAAPLTRLPIRPPGSIRRTATLDAVVDGSWETGCLLSGRARDLVTDVDGSVRASTDGVISARVGAAGELTELNLPASPGFADSLLGRDTRRGFRAVLAEAAQGLGAGASLECMLLDDFPGLRIISGYARVREQRPAGSKSEGSPIGTCSGWRPGGTAALTVDTGFAALGDRPVAPALSTMTDGRGWHEDPPMRPGSMRRRRLLDVIPGDRMLIYGYFRDTYCEPDGSEVVVHEYEIRGIADGFPAALVAVDAAPSSLPFAECQLAAPNVGRLEGTRLGDIDHAVRITLTGVLGCTHLNDLMRTLRFVEPLRDLASRHLATTTPSLREIS